MAGDPDQWVAELMAAANDDPRFETATEQFDGSVALRIGSRTVWFKLYRGSIIDAEGYVPMTGVTFEIVGEPEAWADLVDGDASYSEQLYEGALRTRGNKIEANRVRDGVERLLRHLQEFAWETIE